MEKITKFLKHTDRNALVLLIISVLITVLMDIREPNFLGKMNLQGMLIQFPEYGILAFGMMIAMISGGIDLSLVGIANLSGIVAAVIMLKMGGTDISIVFSIIAALIIGCLCGLCNGFLIGYLQIPAMLVTLCGLQLYTGISLIITKGPAITGLPESFNNIANGTLFGIPVGAVVFILTAILLYYLLYSTVFGKSVYLMGTNTLASKFSGINNLRITMQTYAISGIFGSVSGVLMASHYNSAKSDYGSSYTLLTLLIVVLGGVNPNGGRGKVQGVVMSVILLQLVSSAFNILRVNAFIKTFAWGLILLVIMTGMNLLEKKQDRS